MVYTGSPPYLPTTTLVPMTTLNTYDTYEPLKDKEEASSQVRVAVDSIICNFYTAVLSGDDFWMLVILGLRARVFHMQFSQPNSNFIFIDNPVTGYHLCSIYVTHLHGE